MTTSVHERWQGAEAGRRYARERWAGARSAERDPRIVARILARHGVGTGAARVLDVPCGAGRLRRALESRSRRYVGVDISEPMLAEARRGALVRASAFRLPFQENAFEAVVCCRLFHHLREPHERSALLGELVRVARRLVVVSFWDAASLHAWRHRVGRSRSAAREGRCAVSKAELALAARDVGAEPLSFHHTFRFLSQQTFAVLGKLGSGLDGERGTRWSR